MPSLRFLVQELHRFRLNVIHFCLPHPSKGDFQSKEQPRLSLNPYFAFRCVYFARRPVCLSEHILREMSERYWQRRAGNQLASAHIVQSAHILLIQFWEIARPQKSCHYFVTQSPRWHLLQITSQPAKKRGSRFSPPRTETQISKVYLKHNDTFILNKQRRCRGGKNTFPEMNEWEFDFNMGIFFKL